MKLKGDALSAAAARELLVPYARAILFGESPETTAITLCELVRTVMGRLSERDALRLICAGGDPAGALISGVVRAVAPSSTRSVKKVRFNVYPTTKAGIAELVRSGHARTKKHALDIILQALLERLPAEYWKMPNEVSMILSSSGYTTEHQQATPTSYAMGGQGHALLQDLGTLLHLPLGDVLEAALTLWRESLRERQRLMRVSLMELLDELLKVESIVSRMLEIAPTDCEGVSTLQKVVDELRAGIQLRLASGLISRKPTKQRE